MCQFFLMLGDNAKVTSKINTSFFNHGAIVMERKHHEPLLFENRNYSHFLIMETIDQF